MCHIFCGVVSLYLWASVNRFMIQMYLLEDNSTHVGLLKYSLSIDEPVKLLVTWELFQANRKKSFLVYVLVIHVQAPLPEERFVT